MIKTLMLKKIYLKDINYKSENTPHNFFSGSTVTPNLDLNFNTNKIGDNLFELTMESNVSGLNAEGIKLYSLKVIKGALFEIIYENEEELEECLNVNCPSILFPYLRQEVDNIIHYSGFPAFYMQPISFYDIYESKKAKI